jgi:hypothetical protein
MGLFRKQKPDEPVFARRRVSPADQSSQRTQAFSYYAQRSVPQANTGRGQLPDETTDSERAWYLSRTSVLTVVVLLVAGALYMLTLTGSPKIVPVTSGSNTYFMQSEAVYQQTAAAVLGSSLFNKNKLTVDTAKVIHELQTRYPEIHTASVIIPVFGQRPVVYLTPYRPSCILTTLDNKAYLLDENGRALASTSQITNSGELSVPTVEDKSGLDIKPGSQALPANTVQFIDQVVSILDAAKIARQSLVLPAASSELDAYISGKPYFVKFNLQGDAKLQAGTFLATKERLEQDRVTPSQYIDVRVNERAYYK